MMQEYFIERVREIEREGNARRAKVCSKQTAEAYVADARERIRACFGALPPRVSLNSRTTGILRRQGYRVEKVIFESRPGFLVTANVYLPAEGGGPRPAVIGACGHEKNGKAAAPYQAYAQALVKQGYVVLIFDTVGQGERYQYLTDALQPRRGAGSAEHFIFGNQQLLVGESPSLWFIWDGIRALDYLLSRPEVDAARIGITGSSGGGMQTTWLGALDPRFTMAAPCCFVTTMRRNVENENLTDTEQCPLGQLAHGLDHSDFFAAFAPKPLILLAQEYDFFDVRGAEETLARLRNLYRFLGAEDKIRLHINAGVHGYPQPSREAMYAWFNQAANLPPPPPEPPVALEEDSALWCTPRGQVSELGSRTIFSFTQEASKSLVRQRNPLREMALVEAVRNVIRPAGNDETADFRILPHGGGRHRPKAHRTTYVLETERGVGVYVHLVTDAPLGSRPPKGRHAILYVADISAEDELVEESLLGELIAEMPGANLFACDLRGVGDSAPALASKVADTAAERGDYFHAIHAVMLGESYVAQRTRDLLRVLAWLAQSGCEEVHLAAKGRGTIPATFAALLSRRVTRVTLKGALASYAAVAETEGYEWPLSSFVPGILRSFDLPDCYRALEARRLLQIELRGPGAVRKTM